MHLLYLCKCQQRWSKGVDEGLGKGRVVKWATSGLVSTQSLVFWVRDRDMQEMKKLFIESMGFIQ